uniref:Putative e3 ubiquitin ligase n=1 Tax=Anopheles darlingi TaxID=43151 RepID=A0A2M4CZ81_ANODA
MSVVRTKVLGLVDVIMRVPSLFIIDEILKMGLGVPLAKTPLQSANHTTQLQPSMLLMPSAEEDRGGVEDNIELYKFISMSVLRFLLCSFGAISATCVFMLWTRHLVIVYMYVISVGLIFLSYWSNVSALSLISDSPSLLEDMLSLNTERLLDPGGVLLSILPHLVAQWLMGVIFAYIHLGPRYKITQKALPISFLMPLLLAMLPLPSVVLKHSPAFAAVLPLVLSKIALWSSSFDVVKTILSGYQHARAYAGNFGIATLIENEWQRLNVPSVLRVFWSIRIAEHLISLLMSSDAPLYFAATMKTLLVSGCETLTAVLGMTSIISLICHYIGKMVQLFLLSEDYDEDKSIGTVSAILFYILALQTGLTSLSPDKRFVRLCRNMCLLVTALLHFLHNIVAPILMSLSAARNPSRKRHARALMVCAFLLIAPSSLLAVLWSRHTLSTWLLAVTAFSVEVIVKVLVSLATYTLFLLDARRHTFWEKLDDYVYYIRAFGNSVEFCFGIFLFFNGAWILIFESGGAIRALMMGIHAYFNIWCEARAGWGVFMKRRTAVHKISSLPEASVSQLRHFDDVCAICYQEMTSAKITRCNHYFHSVCLRKWLYVQDRCPLCHEIIMNQDGSPGEETVPDEHVNENEHAPDAASQASHQNSLQGPNSIPSTTNAAGRQSTTSPSPIAKDSPKGAVASAVVAPKGESMSHSYSSSAESSSSSGSSSSSSSAAGEIGSSGSTGTVGGSLSYRPLGSASTLSFSFRHRHVLLQQQPQQMQSIGNLSQSTPINDAPSRAQMEFLSGRIASEPTMASSASGTSDQRSAPDHRSSVSMKSEYLDDVQ